MTPSQIYRLQVWLRAVKQCWACDAVKLVAEFAGYGVTICNACDAVPTPTVEPVVTDELERYFAELKARVGVA